MMDKHKIRKKPHELKCLKCPYYLGIVKCVKSPCVECLLTQKKEHPFVVFLSDQGSSGRK